MAGSREGRGAPCSGACFRGGSGRGSFQSALPPPSRSTTPLPRSLKLSSPEKEGKLTFVPISRAVVSLQKWNRAFTSIFWDHFIPPSEPKTDQFLIEREENPAQEKRKWLFRTSTKACLFYKLIVRNISNSVTCLVYYFLLWIVFCFEKSLQQRREVSSSFLFGIFFFFFFDRALVWKCDKRQREKM